MSKRDCCKNYPFGYVVDQVEAHGEARPTSIILAKSPYDRPRDSEGIDGALWINPWTGAMYIWTCHKWKLLPIPCEQLKSTLCCECCVKPSDEPIQCDEDELLVCSKECRKDTLKRKKLGGDATAAFQCQGTGVSSDKFLVCDDQGQLQRRFIDLTSTPFSQGTIIACGAEGLLAQPFVAQGFSCPPMQSTCVECNDGFLVCDNGDLRNRPIGAGGDLECDNAFVVCDGSNFKRQSVPAGSAAFQCQGANVSSDQFLACDSNGLVQRRVIDLTDTAFSQGTIITCGADGLLAQPFVVGSFSCPPREATCVQINDAFIVCDENDLLHTRPIALGGELECENAFIVSDGSDFKRQTIGTDGGAFQCTGSNESTDRFLVCDASGIVQRRVIDITDTPFSQGTIIACGQDGLLAQPFVPQGFSCPALESTCVECDDGFLVCDGSTLRNRPIATGGDLLCADEFVVCDGTFFKRKALPDASGAFQCTGTNQSIDQFLTCDESGNVQRRVIGLTDTPFVQGIIIACGENGLLAQPFAGSGGSFVCPPMQSTCVECDDGFLVCDAGTLRNRPIGSVAQFGCDNEFVVCDGGTFKRATVNGGRALACNDDFLVCGGVGDVSLQRKLLATDGASNSAFGVNVTLSQDGRVAAIGADQADALGLNSGAAYVFDFDGSSWTQTQKLTASDGTAGDRFGSSISIANNGQSLIVGAFEDTDTVDFEGAAYIFDFDGLSWNETQKLTASDATDGAAFGDAVAIAGDAQTALVGANFASDGTGNPGAAYVFTLSGTWSEQQKLLASDGTSGEGFGAAVALSDNGSVALVGANFATGNVASSGAAYIYTFDGSAWTDETKLVASDGAANDFFGEAVALSADGQTALIGANSNDSTGMNAGAAYVFQFDGSAWNEQAKLVADDLAAGDLFGSSVSLSDNGEIALIGASVGNGIVANSGAAYTFRLVGGSWFQESKVVANDGDASDLFGASVAQSGDAGRFLIGAPGDDDQSSASGAAYTFERSFGQYSRAPLLQDASSILSCEDDMVVCNGSNLVRKRAAYFTPVVCSGSLPTGDGEFSRTLSITINDIPCWQDKRYKVSFCVYVANLEEPENPQLQSISVNEILTLNGVPNTLIPCLTSDLVSTTPASARYWRGELIVDSLQKNGGDTGSITLADIVINKQPPAFSEFDEIRYSACVEAATLASCDASAA